MKVTQEKAPFTPVTLVLESEEELAVLRHLINRGWDDTSLRNYLHHYDREQCLDPFKFNTIKNHMYQLVNPKFKALKG